MKPKKHPGCVLQQNSFGWFYRAVLPGFRKFGPGRTYATELVGPWVGPWEAITAWYADGCPRGRL